MRDAKPSNKPTMPRRALLWSGLLAAGATFLGWRATRAEDGHEGNHWGYEGDNGPDHWGELNEEYQACSTGEHQSPINLTAEHAADLDLPNVGVSYEPLHGFKIEDNGHTVRVPIENDSFAELDGERYKLVEFHFHAPSEHAIEGEQQAMELHMVHAHPDDASRKLVLGVMLAIGADNEPLAPVFNHLPDEVNGLHDVDEVLDPAAVLPGNQQSFRYAGSLTTPPCSEGVSWVVFSEAVEIGVDQAERFLAIHEGNARPFREPEDRDVSEDTTP